MTKKLCLIGAVVLIAAAALALENIALPTGGGFYEGTLYQPRTIVDSNTAAVTPRFIGELLLGKETGSNALWIARDLTTNGWGLITAEGGPFGNANIVDLAATKLTGNIAGDRVTNALAGAAVETNVTVALARQAAPSATNVTVTLLRQLALSMTNIVVQTGKLYDSTGAACSNAAQIEVLVVTNVVIQTAANAAVTNATLTIQTAAVPALTNAVLTIQRVQ